MTEEQANELIAAVEVVGRRLSELNESVKESNQSLSEVSSALQPYGECVGGWLYGLNQEAEEFRKFYNHMQAMANAFGEFHGVTDAFGERKQQW